jgi:hypothetical protein
MTPTTARNSNTDRRRRKGIALGMLFSSSFTLGASCLLSLFLFSSEAAAFAPHRTSTTVARPAFVPAGCRNREMRPCHSQLMAKAKKAKKSKSDGAMSDEDKEVLKIYSSEVVEDEENDDSDWMPDREKAKARKEEARVYVEQEEKAASSEKEKKPSTTKGKDPEVGKNRASPYTEEEEDVIEAMGGRTKGNRKRESGFLGDSTLEEIATDYSVPICYLADVLCMWGVPVPINLQHRLGDLVTGEQAFAIVEAVNSLEIAALHDRYSNQNLVQLCAEWDMDLQEVFEMAMKEGWSLPFGVQTCLRVEQEEELVRVLATGAFTQEEE